MYTNSGCAQDKVTLTKNQLQAILELITQMGGMKNNEPTKEESSVWDPSFRSDQQTRNNSISNTGERREDIVYRNQGSLLEKKQMQWKQEREESIKSDVWFQKFESDEYSRSKIKSPSHSFGGRYSPFSTETSSVPTTPSNSSTKSFPYPPPPTPVTPLLEGKSFRRYARLDLDPNLLEEKRLKVLEYQQALKEQKDEKERRLREEKLKQLEEEEMIEKRFREQQKRLRLEYEEEQRKILDKQKAAEKKRLAVVAAIQRTPSLKKATRQLTSQSESQVQDFARETPENNNASSSTGNCLRRDSSIQTDPGVECEQSSQHRTVGIQTDYSLMYRWFNEIKLTRNGNKSGKKRSTENNWNTSSTPQSRSPTPSPRFTQTNEANTKNNEIKPRHRSPFAFAQTNERNNLRTFANLKLRSATKTVTEGNKPLQTEGNRLKSSENNRLRSQKQNSDFVKRKVNQHMNESNGDYRLSLSSSSSPELHVNGNSINRFHTNSPPIPTIQRRLSEACTLSEKKEICLPNIVTKNTKEAIRPPSRRKWKSQEAFNPNVILAEDDF